MSFCLYTNLLISCRGVAKGTDSLKNGPMDQKPVCLTAVWTCRRTGSQMTSAVTVTIMNMWSACSGSVYKESIVVCV